MCTTAGSCEEDDQTGRESADMAYQSDAKRARQDAPHTQSSVRKADNVVSQELGNSPQLNLQQGPQLPEQVVSFINEAHG